MIRVATAGWALAVGMLCLTGADAGAAEYEYAKRGQAIAERLCAQCHAVGKTGKSPHKDAPPFRTFAAKWPLEDLEESLAEGIVTGHPDMPPFAFEPDDIAALIDHLHDVAEAPVKTPAETTR